MPATISPVSWAHAPARVARLEVEMTPIWLTKRVAKVHHATLLADPKSVPFKWKSRRSLRPDLRMGRNSQRACAITPTVDRPATTAICADVMDSAARMSPAGPHRCRNRAREAIPTTLFITGAHMYGPNMPRALSSSPRRLYRP